MSTSRQVSGVKEVETENGTTYEIQYFVLEADLSSYVPEIGSVATWAPVNAKVTECLKDPVGHDGTGCYLLTISAEPTSDDEGSEGGSFDRDELDKNVKPNYTLTDLYFPMAWWGIRLAAKEDVEKKIKNVYDAVCKLGDYLYADATASSKGTASFKKSPFKDDSVIAGEFVERKIKIPVYTVTFYTKDAVVALGGFYGVNPENGFPRDVAPEKVFKVTAEKWLAVDQDIAPVFNRKKIKYWRVTRICQYAPGTLRWDKDKNLGYWAWLSKKAEN
jgi:hypothetical protein